MFPIAGIWISEVQFEAYEFASQNVNRIIGLLRINIQTAISIFLNHWNYYGLTNSNGPKTTSGRR